MTILCIEKVKQRHEKYKKNETDFPEIKTTMPEMKNTLGWINERLSIEEGRICELK